MTMLPLTAISTHQFGHYIDAYGTHVFDAEASDFKSLDLFKRMFDDACDVGFVLVSHKTGKGIPMVLSQESRDPENEVSYWHFIPANIRDRELKIMVKLYND